MKSKSKALREIMATGKIGGWNIGVSVEPRIIVSNPNRRYILSSRTGRNSDNEAFPIDRLREFLTSDRAETTFQFTAVDRRTLEKESGTIRVVFNGYDCTDNHGTVKAGRLISKINCVSETTGEMRNPEQLVGLETDTIGRILFNVEGSKPDNGIAGFDRTIENDAAVLWLNTQTGDWYAQRKDGALKQMGELAEIGLENLTIHDLLDAALVAAPKVTAEF
jgi:hypothetical protein